MQTGFCQDCGKAVMKTKILRFIGQQGVFYQAATSLRSKDIKFMSSKCYLQRPGFLWISPFPLSFFLLLLCLPLCIGFSPLGLARHRVHALPCTSREV